MERTADNEAGKGPSNASQPPPAGAAESPAIPNRKLAVNKLKLARDQVDPLPEGESMGVIKEKKILEPEEVRPPLDLHPRGKKRKAVVSQPLLAFLVFLLIGGASGYLRYGGLFTPEQMEPYLQYAWGAVLLLHIIIIIKALTNDMMQGILCLFIPGWSLIYLAISDHFYQKAIIFGLLIGIGENGGYQLFDFATAGFQSVQEFINSGGGAVKRH